MAARPIVIAPDPRLNSISKHVEVIDDSIAQLARDMLDTMYEADGIGLAAIQIGVAKRVIVIDINHSSEHDRTPIVMINAEVIESSDETSSCNEGCLSFPGNYNKVDRPRIIKVKYQDLEGKEHIIEADGIFSTCIQHEIDHTNGINYVDHIPAVKKQKILENLVKYKKSKY